MRAARAPLRPRSTAVPMTSRLRDLRTARAHPTRRTAGSARRKEARPAYPAACASPRRPRRWRSSRWRRARARRRRAAGAGGPRAGRADRRLGAPAEPGHDRAGQRRMFLRRDTPRRVAGRAGRGVSRMDHPLGGRVRERGARSHDVGDNPAFSETLLGGCPCAGCTYIICTNCEAFVVPEALRGQVKMVHGLEVDKCLSLESQTHWVKASVSPRRRRRARRQIRLRRRRRCSEDMTSAPAPTRGGKGTSRT